MIDRAARPRPPRRLFPVLATGLVAVLAVVTFMATAKGFGSAFGVGSDPEPSLGTNPGAAVIPSEAPGTEAILIASPSTASASPSPRPTPSPTATPKPKPKAFSMDLYHRGDYVGEKTKIWCLPAAMQTSINVMSPGADRTYVTQQRLFDLSRSLAPAPDGAAEPEGWAMGLTTLRYGRYEVQVHPTIRSAIQTAAKALRRTNRPVGLMVWRGAHSWVMSGFTATADPRPTSRFTVTAVRIEDVWYPRFSTIWGYSHPPDTLYPVASLSQDFKPWKRPQARYPAKDGRYVIVVPTR